MASSDPRPGSKGRDPQGGKVEYREIVGRGRRPLGGWFWLALVLVPLLLASLTVAAQRKRVELDLSKRSVAALEDAGYASTVMVEGRDATVGIKDLNTQQQEEATRIVKDVAGVRAVAFDEKIVEDTEGEGDSDDSSEDSAEPTSTESSDSDATPTETESAGDSESAGNFTLTGGTDSVTVAATVADKDAQEELIDAVKEEVGEAKVIDKVKVSKDADAVNAKAIASLATEVAALKGVSATADSSSIVLEGTVKSETIKDDIAAKAKAAAGDREVDNQLKVEDGDETATSTPSATESATEDSTDKDDDAAKDTATESECEDINKSVAASLKAKKILFVTGSAKVDQKSYASLKSIATKLKPCVTGDNASEHSLEVKGHTDNTGSAAANKRLSARRAASVAAILVKYGIPKSEVKSAGFGQTSPIASNNTPTGRKANRRVEIVWK